MDRCAASIARLVLGSAVLGACLDPNVDFDGPATTGTDASTAADGSADTSASCEPDGFEPNDETEAALVPGSYEAVLEEVGAVDLYNYYIDGAGTAELYLAADADVRVCAFVGCEGTFDPPEHDCVTGLSGVSQDGQIGCCGGPAVAIAFTCAPGMGAKIHMRVDEAPADCTYYGLELADALP